MIGAGAFWGLASETDGRTVETARVTRGTALGAIAAHRGGGALPTGGFTRNGVPDARSRHDHVVVRRYADPLPGVNEVEVGTRVKVESWGGMVSISTRASSGR